MFPELFRIGDFVVTSFGLMMFLSFVSAAYVCGRQMERFGYPRELAWDVLAWVAIGGIVGAKLYYLALHWEDLAADPVGELFSRGGLVWYGGLIGGVTAYYLQVRAKKLPVAMMYDATAPARAVDRLLLAIADMALRARTRREDRDAQRHALGRRVIGPDVRVPIASRQWDDLRFFPGDPLEHRSTSLAGIHAAWLGRRR